MGGPALALAPAHVVIGSSRLSSVVFFNLSSTVVQGILVELDTMSMSPFCKKAVDRLPVCERSRQHQLEQTNCGCTLMAVVQSNDTPNQISCL